MMLERLLKYADSFDMFPDGCKKVLAAVSGGADSVCMLHLLREAGKKRGFSICAAHFDHCLRGEESKRDARFTSELCEKLGVELISGSGNVRAFAEQNAVGLEEAARRMRYDFLYSAKEKLGAQVIATAHNADDNAETVLMRLARGTGTKGLAGIPPKRGDIIRPILFLSREEIIGYLSENGIEHVEDSTNAEDIYTRNRIRHNLVPVMRSINPSFSESVSDMSELMRRDEDYLSGLAREFVCRHGKHIDVSELNTLPYAVSSRVIRLASGCELQKKHVDAILDISLGKSSSSVDYPGGRATVSCGKLCFGEHEALTFSPFEIRPGESRRIENTGITVSVFKAGDSIINKSFTVFLFKSTEICGTITVRPRAAGDSIRLKGTGMTKTLKKLFIERRVPRDERELIPVVSDDKGILGVCFIGENDRGSDISEKDSIIIMFEGDIKA